MARQGVDWDEMYKALSAFCRKQGHCKVPANSKKNPQLGRWVAMQRYRRKLGEVTAQQVEKLDKLGFVWSPTDRVWDGMFDRLLKFKKKQGNCDVPSQWARDLSLANWVANQRHRNKMGTLAPERVKRLEAIGFSWAVYGRDKPRKAKASQEASRETPTAKGSDAEERLYHVVSEYIQYNGVGPLPTRLEKFMKMRGGDFPPYIPLPGRPLVFKMNGDAGNFKVKWAGKGPLPEDVRIYLNENGVLPPHD